LQFLIQIFLVVPSALLDRKLRFKERAIYDIGTAVAGTVATLLMALGGLGVWSIVFGNLGMVVLYTALINWKFPFAHTPVFRFKGIESMAKFGFLTVLGRILWYFYSQADTFLVGRLLGKTVLGFYSVGVQIATLPLVKISGIFNQLAMAGFSQIKNDPVKIRGSVIVVARVASFISVPVFWGIAAVATEFVTLILGETWKPAIFPLQCIALMLPVRVLSIALSQAINALGRPELNVINLAVACIVMPSAFVLGILEWGLEGISLAWICIYPLWFIYVLRQCLPSINLRSVDYLRSVAPPYLIGGVMGLTIFFVRDWIVFGEWLRFALLVVIGALIYIGLFVSFARSFASEAILAMRRDAN
jgi:teichuronic acid exporter